MSDVRCRKCGKDTLWPLYDGWHCTICGARTLYNLPAPGPQAGEVAKGGDAIERLWLVSGWAYQNLRWHEDNSPDENTRNAAKWIVDQLGPVRDEAIEERDALRADLAAAREACREALTLLDAHPAFAPGAAAKLRAALGEER